jgi:hypothetical protein
MLQPNYCMHQPGRAASGPLGSERTRPARPAGDACVAPRKYRRRSCRKRL